ncbi:hypothetical protein CHAD_09850 [Corynebacterium hadale]|nr:hypothetical protein CHAD_09850 [Corynebacterium hadale]
MSVAMQLGLHPRALLDLDDIEVATVKSIIQEWSNGR